jgi:hypothetical protein
VLSIVRAAYEVDRAFGLLGSKAVSVGSRASGHY